MIQAPAARRPAPAPRWRFFGHVARHATLSLGVLIGGLAIGCGPITAHQSIRQATISVEAARAAQADRYAVYEFVSSVEFLKKARELEGYSEFQDAVNLAKTAAEYADKAKTRALNNPSRGLSPVPGSTPVEGDADPNDNPEAGVPEGSSL